jgi:CDP-paratose 2-epimerase
MGPDWEAPKIINLGGGIKNSMSLKELSNWCEDRFGKNNVVASQEERIMDAPWIVMDSTTAQNSWDWTIRVDIQQILEEIANHAEQNPDWLKLAN